MRAGAPGVGALGDLGPFDRFWDLVERRAQLTPDRVMLLDEHGRHLTFGQFRDASEEVAAALVDRGIQPGARVSWQVPTSIEATVLMGALCRIDTVQNLVVPLLREHEVDFIVGETRAEHLVVVRAWRGFDHAAMAEEIAGRRGCQVHVIDLGWSSELDLPRGDPSSLPPFEQLLDDDRGARAARWIFYSSGTTGVPKGVMHSDLAMTAAPGLLLERGHMTADDVFSIPYAITHVGGPTMIAAQLRVPLRMLLVGSFDAATTPEIFADLGLTIPGSASPFFQTYLNVQNDRGERLFPDARVAISGGAAVPPEMHYRVKDELAPGGVLSVWGMTEFPMATCTDLDDPDPLKAETVGRAGTGVEIKIVDPRGAPAPPGVEGEIVVRGPQRLLGYVDSALDVDAFDDEGYFRSGDLGVLDESGVMRVTGRIKDVIIRNAENVSAAEVESILGRHPLIEDVTVIGLPDERTGERVCAVIVQAPDSEPLAVADLGVFCREQGMAAYKIPEQVLQRDALPRDALGKLVKATLRDEILASEAHLT